MNLPALLFGLLLGLAIGASYHLVRGGSLSRLLLYLLSSLVGFAAGHLVGIWLDWSFIRLGAINLFAAVLGALVALVLADILAPPAPSNGGEPSPPKPSVHPNP